MVALCPAAVDVATHKDDVSIRKRVHYATHDYSQRDYGQLTEGSIIKQ